MNFIIPKQIMAYKYVLTLFIVISTLIFFPIYHSFIDQNQSKLALLSPIKILNKEIRSGGLTVAQIVKKNLDEKFEQLLADLQKEFPITKKAWKKALNEFEDLKKNDKLFSKNPVIKHNKGDTPLIKKTRELLASYNIDPKKVAIEMLNDPQNASYAFAGQRCISNVDEDRVEHYLQLNLPQLLQQTPKVQEALLRHEIMHLINYDSLVCAFIEELLKEHGITPEEFWANDTFSNFNKHIEYRADLMASTHNVETAQALKEGFVKHMNRYDDTTDSRTHPSCKSRNAALDNLIQYMKTENQSKLA